MKARGEFAYKGLDRRDGGEFINDKGQTIKYKDSFILKVDEVVDGDINERKLKVDPDNTYLTEKLKKLKPYDKFILECDIILYQNSAKVVPVAIVDSNNK